MMASSQDRAIALKDSYVDTLLKGGVTAPLQGMPETDMGQQASVYIDLPNQIGHQINDGKPTVYTTNGQKTTTYTDYDAAMPVHGAGFGAKQTVKIPNQHIGTLGRDMYQRGERELNMKFDLSPGSRFYQ